MRRHKPRRLDADEVTAAAVAIALETGLHAVDLAAVADRLRVAPKSVSAAVPDFGDVVAAAFRSIVAAELADVKRIALAHPSPAAQMRALLDTLAEPMQVAVDSVWLEALSLGGRCTRLGAEVRAEESAWHAFIAAVIRRGVRSGEFLDVDPDEVAAHLLVVIDGVNAYALVGYRSDVDRRKLLYSFARTHLGSGIDLPEGERIPANA